MALAPLVLSYSVVPGKFGGFDVVCDQDRTIYGHYEDEDTADFVAGEAFSDDAVQIAHEHRG